jgi:hypothetical protein
MNKVGTNLLIALLAVPFLMTCAAQAQDAAAMNDRELNTKAYVELLQTGVDAKREAIVKEIMQFSDSDAQKFWPIYKEYDAQRAKLDAAEAQILQEYAKEYQTISNEKAEQLLDKSFGIEAQRVELKKKYFKTIKSALSATTAARFIEVENQLEDVAGLQATAVLPANQAN